MALRVKTFARNALSAINRTQIAASFSTVKRGGGRKRGGTGGKDLARTGPPPPAVTSDPWQPVIDKASGQTYYWNVMTDATTALGEPKPVSMTAQQQQEQALAQAQAQQPQGPGFMGMVAQGMAFGAGSSMAHHAIGGLFGGGGGGGGHDDSGSPPSGGGDDGSWDI